MDRSWPDSELGTPGERMLAATIASTTREVADELTNEWRDIHSDVRDEIRELAGGWSEHADRLADEFAEANYALAGSIDAAAGTIANSINANAAVISRQLGTISFTIGAAGFSIFLGLAAVGTAIAALTSTLANPRRTRSSEAVSIAHNIIRALEPENPDANLIGDAERMIATALRQDPSHSFAYELSALLKELMGKTESALEDRKRAFALSEKDFTDRLKYALALFKYERYDDVLHILDPVWNEDDITIVLFLRALLKTGKENRAIESMKIIIKRQPHKLGAYLIDKSFEAIRNQLLRYFKNECQRLLNEIAGLSKDIDAVEALCRSSLARNDGWKFGPAQMTQSWRRPVRLATFRLGKPKAPLVPNYSNLLRYRASLAASLTNRVKVAHDALDAEDARAVGEHDIGLKHENNLIREAKNSIILYEEKKSLIRPYDDDAGFIEIILSEFTNFKEKGLQDKKDALDMIILGRQKAITACERRKADAATKKANAHKFTRAGRDLLRRIAQEPIGS